MRRWHGRFARLGRTPSLTPIKSLMVSLPKTVREPTMVRVVIAFRHVPVGATTGSTVMISRSIAFMEARLKPSMKRIMRLSQGPFRRKRCACYEQPSHQEPG